MKCAKETKPCKAEYDPLKDYMVEDVNLERRIRSLFGLRLKPKTMAWLKDLREHLQSERLDEAIDEALALMKQAGRRICCVDLGKAMERAVARQLTEFDRRPTLLNAVRLIATLNCQDLLTVDDAEED